jgi:hypothetical protein
MSAGEEEDDAPKARDPRAAARPPWESPPPDLPVAVLPPPAPGRLPRLRAEPGYESLAGFLAGDLQGGRRGLERLLGQLERVRRGSVGGIKRTGNAYVLHLARPAALVQPLHEGDEDDCRIDLEMFERVLRAWQAALEA